MHDTDKLIFKKYRSVIIYLGFAAFNLYILYPSWLNIIDIDRPDLKIYYSNILTSNREHKKLIKSIYNEQPDIIVLQEVNKRWADQLKVLNKDYPHKILIPRENNFGMAVFSKIQFMDQEIFRGKADVESMLFTINTTEKVNILSTHPLPPVSTSYWELRNNQYNEIIEIMNKIDGEKVIIGDLNTTSWSVFLSRLSEKTNLEMVNTFRDTWNSLFPIGMRIRLDHVMISKGILGELEVLNNIGSDHLPMLVKLKVKR